jgi:hypothetical protein
MPKKSIDIRAKGSNAERDIVNDLNLIIREVMKGLGYSEAERDNHTFLAQRNQNQSAVGGKDLVNTYGYAIEVKRQEALSINTWWNQCVASAEKHKEVPVLLYKQNRQPWKCVTTVYLELGDNMAACRGEISYQSFLAVFKMKVLEDLSNPRIMP